jgi:hypothetical protein
MQKIKAIHITYIGRLEKEKGIEIVIDSIKRWIAEKREIVWHICWDGSYRNKIQSINSKNIQIYWRISRDKINTVLDQTDFVIMPSLFLETFGLVALETLSYGVPVVWFSQGGLTDFIQPTLALDSTNPVDSLFKIIDNWTFPLIDISDFSYENWISKLTELTMWLDKILLVNDYIELVGWAEQYVHNLAKSLRSLGKTVEIFGYIGNTNRWIRIWLMMIAPISFWRGRNLNRRIQEFNPDLIWMHSILRYIGPYWIQVISDIDCKKSITYHDLGMITPRPSQVYSISDIPMTPSLADWIPKKINIFSIIVTFLKWWYIQIFWYFLLKNEVSHIVPSSWMSIYYQKYSNTTPIIFPHSIDINYTNK